MSVEREKGKSELWKEGRDSLEKGWREKKEISFAKLSFSGMEGKMNFDEMLPER